MQFACRVMAANLHPKLRTFMHDSCIASHQMDISNVEEVSRTVDKGHMANNPQYAFDLYDLDTQGYSTRRVPEAQGESLFIGRTDRVSAEFKIGVSGRYPFDRPEIWRDGLQLDISSYWTPQTSLVDLLKTSESVEDRYQLYDKDKDLVRVRLLQQMNAYAIKIAGMQRMRRSVLCRHLADFEMVYHLSPFTSDLDVLMGGLSH
jgi:hypothetical protein